MLSDVQREEIRRFADRITPKSWHIILEPEDERMEPGILNIHLLILGPDNEVYTDHLGQKCYPYEEKNGALWYTDRDGNILQRSQVKPILGMIYGRMVFKEITTPGRGCKGKVAHISVRLWPYLGDWKETLIHELAHVAVYRYQAFRTKDYTHKALFRNPWNIDLKSLLIEQEILREGHHGPSFQKAFFTLTRRVAREFRMEISDDDIRKSLINDLKF